MLFLSSTRPEGRGFYFFYEFECIKHQPPCFNKLRARVNYDACGKCPLNKEGEFCRLGEVRVKLQELYLSGKVPKIFEQLIFG